jgi:hypothetical protein
MKSCGEPNTRVATKASYIYVAISTTKIKNEKIDGLQPSPADVALSLWASKSTLGPDVEF